MTTQVPRSTLPGGARASRLLRAEARRLLASLHSGSMSETAYDTAWVARVRDPTNAAVLAFPSAMAWLLRNQHGDGSWGATPALTHDRVVSTLAAVLALLEGPDPTPAAEIARGITYLQRALPRLDQDSVETVGFELIMPPLLTRARTHGLDLPYDACINIDRLRADKLRRLPPGFVYSGPTSLTYSLEFLGDDLAPNLARRSRAPNGSYGASPAATAYVLTHQWDEEAARYLRTILALAPHGGVFDVFPFEVFEKGWVLYHLAPMARLLPAYRHHLADLAAAWTSAGVGFTSHGMIADADDTAIVFKVLSEHQFPLDPQPLKLFEAEEYFVTYPLERNQSVSTNAHVLDAVKECRGLTGRERMVRKAVRFLATNQLDGCYWRDKWHASPYYATSRAAVALAGAGDEAEQLRSSAAAWLLATQQPNGSWSELVPGGTGEETAYALLALMSFPVSDRATRESMDRAAAYLWGQLDDRDYPQLWVGKGLYTPYAVVNAAILGALYSYQTSSSAATG